METGTIDYSALHNDRQVAFRMTPTLVFDIETIPDTAGLRVPSSALDEDVANIVFHRRK